MTGRGEPRVQQAAIVAGLIGNLLEWYDLTLYGFFAAIFATVFFPSGMPGSAFLSTVLTFGLRFFMWPLGALFFGPYGDRRGRRAALGASIVLMGLGSLVIGILPGYQRMGILAPVLLVCARLLQGFSAGGEFGGAASFLVEHAAPGRRGFAGSFQQSSAVAGVLLASGVGSLTGAVLPHDALLAWGWRIPFLIGALVAAYGLYLRRRVEETPAFRSLQQGRRTLEAPLHELFTRYPRQVLAVVGMALGGTVASYVWLIHLPTLAAGVLKLPLSSALSGNAISLGVLALLIPLMGTLSDQIGRKQFLAGFAIGTVLCAYPLFLVLQRATFVAFLGVGIIAAALLSLFSGTIAAAMAELYPTEVRYSGIALPYSLAVALFGGTAPLLTAYLMGTYKTYLVLSYYVIVAAAISAVVYLLLPETYKKPLT